MDKNRKHHREKTVPAEDLAEFRPVGASFDTEEGRAAQGMRPDIGADQATDGTTDAEPAPAPAPQKKAKLPADGG